MNQIKGNKEYIIFDNKINMFVCVCECVSVYM